MKLLLHLAATVQLLILIASALTPWVLNWHKNLVVLHPFLRRLFWVYGAFIVMVIIAFAILTFVHVDAMADGQPVARSLCAFIAIFWGARLFVQFAIFNADSAVTTALSRSFDASTQLRPATARQAELAAASLSRGGRGGDSWLNIGYHVLTLAFAFLTIVYGKAAW